MNNTRRLFASFQWHYSNEKIYSYVFDNHEIETLPLKWLKYLLLARVGLTTVEQLNKDIHRFLASEINRVEEDINLRLAKSQANNEDTLIVIKGVFRDQAGQLPNFRVHESSDIGSALQTLKAQYLNQIDEIWTCQSSVTRTSSSLGGRITFPKNFSSSVLEIVWHTSPRRIEDFGLNDKFPYPFLRAGKMPGKMGFSIDNFHVPTKYSRLNSRLFLDDAQFVLTQFYLLRENVELLKDILFGAGAKELSLEFKISDGRFHVIDWDTELEILRR